MAVVYSDAGFVCVFKVIDQKAEVCGYVTWADFKSNSVHSTTCGYMLNVDRECLRKPINIMKKLSVSTLQKNRFKTFEEKASYSTGILSNMPGRISAGWDNCQPDCRTRRMEELFI